MSNYVNVNGSCHCGRIQISGKVSEDMVIACHCTDCQQFSGAPFRPVAIIKNEDIKISGEVTEYTKVADSGNKRFRGFAVIAVVKFMLEQLIDQFSTLEQAF